MNSSVEFDVHSLQSFDHIFHNSVGVIMARITVEDCLEVVPNRFELTLLASKRARVLATGTKEPKVSWDNDKPTVVALREIAAGITDFSEPADEPELDFSLSTETSEVEAELSEQTENTEQQAEAEKLLTESSLEDSLKDLNREC